MKALLVNPWIEDYAAFDLWARPLGLLYVGAILEKLGVEVQLVDCMAREIIGGMSRKWGTGKYPRKNIKPPDILKGIERKYYRYGMSDEDFFSIMDKIQEPDFVFITCLMTYWYTGALRTARLLKKRFKKAKIVLGGVYAFLCKDHAKALGAFDYVLTGKTLQQVEKQIMSLLGVQNISKKTLYFPSWHLYGRRLYHFAVISGWGCPFKCTYCATPLMYEELERKPVADILTEIEWALKVTGAEDIAFYDDALLVNSSCHAVPLFEGIKRAKLSIRFHLPNAIHPRYLDRKLARLMKDIGVTTVRLGFESVSKGFEKRSSNKIDRSLIERGVKNLLDEGFDPENIAAYVLFGAPSLSFKDTFADIDFIHSLGIKSLLAAFSPIPGTVDFYEAIETNESITKEPLLQNNTLAIEKNRKVYSMVHGYMLELNRKISKKQ